VEFEPRFDYGLHLPTMVRRAHGILATDRDNDVATVATDPAISWHIDEGRAVARFSLSAEQAAWFVHRFDDDEVHPAAGYRSQEKLEATAQWWDAWSSRLTYQGPYRQEVERSALVLKLCTYEPSGALIAAPTTSVPESFRGSRPVRIGNGAADQFQLDVYGEVLDAANIWRARHTMTEGVWKAVRDLVDWAAAHWQEPDWSIWEPRHEPKHHVFSKVMAWVA